MDGLYVYCIFWHCFVCLLRFLALYCMLIAFFGIVLCSLLGVYLPLFWEQSFCWHVPIALGYTRGHFAALVPMEVDIFGSTGAQANISNNDDDDDDDDDDVPMAYLPLMDFEGKILPIHFLQPSEVRSPLIVLL